MSAMLAALRNKKQGMAKEGDHQDATHPSEHADDKTADMHSFVAGLSDKDKTHLKTILNTAPDKSMQIAKGGSSTEEDLKVKGAMSHENQNTTLMQNQEEGSGDEGHDSDDIAKSMLDSKHLGDNPPTAPPRNLGERMKMSLAAKLKSKGKI